jgi:hypothetical protein
VADHLRHPFADDLIAQKTIPLPEMLIGECVAAFRIAAGDGDRDIIGEKAQLTFAVAEQIARRLPSGGDSRSLFKMPVRPANGVTSAPESRSAAAGDKRISSPAPGGVLNIST